MNRKQSLIIMLMLVMAISLLLASCGDTEKVAETTLGTVDEITTSPTTTNAPAVTTPAESEEGKIEVGEHYTAVLNESSLGADDALPSEFSIFGTGTQVINEINKDYNGYRKTYFVKKGDSLEEISKTNIQKMATAGAAIAKKDDSAKTIEVHVSEITIRLEPEWTKVTAKAGAYLMFDLSANCAMNLTLTVTAKEGGAASSAAYVQEDIAIEKSGNCYVGVGKCTVPYAVGKTMYINLCLNTSGTSVLSTIPLTITTAQYDSPYQLYLYGNFELLNLKDYHQRLTDMFFSFFPRIYQRFGSGIEPKVVKVYADKDYDGVAYCSGDRVVFSTNFANGNGEDLAFFPHEFTHIVQHFEKMDYGDGAYFTEAIADYGLYRYWRWVDDESDVRINSLQNPAIRENLWGPYKAHNTFFSYLDFKWPTTKNEDGTLKYGLIDTLVFNTKTSKVEIHDDPYREGSIFNNWVKEVTGLPTLEAVRLQFIEDIDNDVFNFTGFHVYQDNFLVEGIPNVPDPYYIRIEKLTPSGESHTPLAIPITSGDNLMLGASVDSATSEGTATQPLKYLFDGDLSTRYQATVDTIGKKLRGVENEVLLDLGEVKTFDTYTLVNAGTTMSKNFNTKFWEVLVSQDGKEFVSVDHQSENKEGIVSVNIGEQSARYIKLRLYESDANGVGTARLFEFMLFSTK